MVGAEAHALAKRLWPINRSITGDGVRETLAILRREMPSLRVHEVPSGTVVFDWVVPKEWRVRDAYIITPSGRRICSVRDNNLHLVGYSVPVRKKMRLSELQEHLHSLPSQPSAVPYVTSYYRARWGFCISQSLRDTLEDGEYEVIVDTELLDGSLTYGELVIPGETDREIFLSTYVCHPSMANNELSGPVVTTLLAKWLQGLGHRRYTYRIVFVPETIGSITYLSRHKDHLRAKVFAGFNVTCVGDDRDYSYLPSRRGNTPSDIAAIHVLRHVCPTYKSYGWSDRGSDERQYCSPGIDLPIASIMRTKFGQYDEYHTSLDDLENVVTPAGLDGGFRVLKAAIEALEANHYPLCTVACEPQLGRRGLYPTLSTKGSSAQARLLVDLLSWSDGSRSLLEISDICGVPIWQMREIAETLVQHGLLELHDEPGHGTPRPLR